VRTTRTETSAQDSIVRGPSAAERITVALVARSATDLQSAQDRTGMSKTDIVNRAISLYEFVDAKLTEGCELIIRNPETGQNHTIVLL
jgi:hypothetical protein